MQKQAQISYAVTAQLISAIVFATRIVQFLFFLNDKSEISSFEPSSVSAQASLCQTWSETPKTWFLTSRLICDWFWQLKLVNKECRLHDRFFFPDCLKLTYEPPNEKTNNLYMRNQRRRSASQSLISEADQCLCFCYMYSTIPFLSEIQNFQPPAIFCVCAARFVSDLFENHIVCFLITWLI